MPFRKPHPPLAWALLLATCLLGCKRESEKPADPPAPQADAAPTAVDASATPAVPVGSTPGQPAGAAPAAPGPSTNPTPPVAAPATPPPAAVAPVTPPPAPVAPLPAEVRRVVGRWVRPDGGYVLDLKSLADDGRLAAAYLNPRPIRISRAEARLEDGQTRVFVELTDENYPGCTYTLTYLPQADQLHGVYYQALMQESYEVHFVRETSAP